MHGLERDIARLRENLQKLDSAGCDPGEEELGRRDRLSRTPVVHRAVRNEMLIATAPEDTSERLGGTSANAVPPRFDGAHGCDAS
jgi:hypothetical protein